MQKTHKLSCGTSWTSALGDADLPVSRMATTAEVGASDKLVFFGLVALRPIHVDAESQGETDLVLSAMAASSVYRARAASRSWAAGRRLHPLLPLRRNHNCFCSVASSCAARFGTHSWLSKFKKLTCTCPVAFQICRVLVLSVGSLTTIRMTTASCRLRKCSLDASINWSMSPRRSWAS